MEEKLGVVKGGPVAHIGDINYPDDGLLFRNLQFLGNIFRGEHRRNILVGVINNKIVVLGVLVL